MLSLCCAWAARVMKRLGKCFIKGRFKNISCGTFQNELARFWQQPFEWKRQGFFASKGHTYDGKGKEKITRAWRKKGAEGKK